jgi:DNA methyltransferase 1-associated protein 1
MAASAADIRSALSIQEPSSSAGPSQTKKPVPSNTRKPEGISRELYSLIGPSAPSLAAQLAKPRLKQRPNFGGRSGKTKWSVFFSLLTSEALISSY